MLDVRFDFSWRSVADDTTPFDLAGLAEVGGGYKFEKCWLYISLMGNASFTSYIDGGTFKHYGMVWSVGVKKRI